MKQCFAAAFATLLASCAPRNDAMERKIDALTTEVKELRAEVERTRYAPTVSVEWRDVDVEEAVAEIARQARVQIRFEAKCQGKITCAVRDVPWHLILETVVKTLGDYRVLYDGPGVARIVRGG